MKRLILAPFLAFTTLAGAPAPDNRSFVQVSVHTASLGKAVVHEVAVATLPGDPLTTFEVDGDHVTVTHYCR